MRNFKANWKVFNRQNQETTLNRKIFGPFNNKPRVQLYVPKEETFLIPLKYIDVTRSTHTNLDVLQEIHMDDFGNVDTN